MLRQLRKLMVTIQGIVAEKKLSANVQKVSDLKEMVSYGVMRTPGLVVDSKVVCAGRTPSRDEILGWIGNSSEARA